MRIGIFTETFLPKWDGVANTLCHLLEHLQRRGHEVLVIAPEGAPDVYAGARIIGLPSFPLPFYPALKLAPPLRNAGREMLDFRPDLLHLVNPAVLAHAGLRRARELDVPVVMSYHTDLPGYTRRYGVGFAENALWAYFRWLHNQADLNLAPSSWTRDEMRANGIENIRLWGRGVNTQKFRPGRRSEEWRRRLGATRPDDIVCLNVGRLAVEKRLEVMRPALDAYPQVKMAFVGDGPHRPELERVFAGTGTTFLGYLEGEDLADAYAAGDVFVFPATHDTFGNVILEGMASGLPVIAARKGGPVDLVQETRNGFLFEPDNPDAFAARLGWLLRDDDLRRRLGAGARSFAERMTWERILDWLIADYGSVVEDHAERRLPAAPMLSA